ncbi:MAG: hypothetical protein ACW99A_23565 [Candidatus Kariarchaeaceae archaeon]
MHTNKGSPGFYFAWRFFVIYMRVLGTVLSTHPPDSFYKHYYRAFGTALGTHPPDSFVIVY